LIKIFFLLLLLLLPVPLPLFLLIWRSNWEIWSRAINKEKPYAGPPAMLSDRLEHIFKVLGFARKS